MTSPLSPSDPDVVFVPGHCMYRPNMKVMDDECPYGYTWREPHYRRKPKPQDRDKYMNRFQRKLTHRLAKHPVLCGEFEDLDEFQNCMRQVEKTMRSYLLTNPSRSAIRGFTNLLVERVITCAGKRLQHRCHLQPTTRMRRYIEREIAQHIE